MKNSTTTEKKKRFIHGIRELSEFLECSTSTANKLVKDNKIDYLKVGGKLLFERENILDRFRMNATCEA